MNNNYYMFYYDMTKELPYITYEELEKVEKHSYAVLVEIFNSYVNPKSWMPTKIQQAQTNKKILYRKLINLQYHKYFKRSERYYKYILSRLKSKTKSNVTKKVSSLPKNMQNLISKKITMKVENRIKYRLKILKDRKPRFYEYYKSLTSSFIHNN